MTQSLQSALRSRIHDLKQELAGLRQQLRLVDTLAGQDAFEVLVCRVGARKVALAKSEVQRVVLAAELAQLPDSPPWVAGLLNYAGDLLPVIDLWGRFERRRRPMDTSDAIVLVGAGERRLGLIVQEATGIETICGGVLRQIVDEAAETPFVLGVVPTDDGTLLVLSTELLIDNLDTTIA